MPGAEPRILPDGLVLRAATENDVDALVAIYVEAFGEQDGPDVRAFAAEEEVLARWSVVSDGDTLASAIGRIDHQMQLDGLEFTTAQIEYVATNPAYQRRGLVAAQMDWHHDSCRADGIPLLMIGGIPYFYRRFGYGYGINSPTLFRFDREHVVSQTVGEVRVRDAMDRDVDAIMRLEAERPTDGLRVLRSRREWERALRMCRPNAYAHLLVAEAKGRVVGWCRVFDHPDEGRSFLLPSVATNTDAVTALVQRSLDLAEDRTLVGLDSPGTAFAEQLRVLGAPFEYGLGYYARIPDPLGFLEMLRPLLSQRLAESDLADATGTLEISLYNTGIAIDFTSGAVTTIHSIPGVEDPTDYDSIGVAPDWFPALVLGRWKATELARRVDDVIIARDHHLMNIFFPERTSDVAGDF